MGSILPVAVPVLIIAALVPPSACLLAGAPAGRLSPGSASSRTPAPRRLETRGSDKSFVRVLVHSDFLFSSSVK